MLVEFRAEDEKVPIKPEHKMTRAQVERELPWQHMLFFVRAEEPPPDKR